MMHQINTKKRSVGFDPLGGSKVVTIYCNTRADADLFTSLIGRSTFRYVRVGPGDVALLKVAICQRLVDGSSGYPEDGGENPSYTKAMGILQSENSAETDNPESRCPPAGVEKDEYFEKGRNDVWSVWYP